MRTRILKYIWVATVLILISCRGFAGSDPEPVALTLKQAVTLALEHYPDVQQAALSLRLAELELEAAWARSTIPSISLQLAPPDLSMSGLSSSIQGIFGMAISLPWGTQTNLSADLKLAWDSKTGEWDIPGWGIIYSQQLDLAQLDVGAEELRAKQRAVTGAQSTLEQTRDDVVLKTIEAYSNLLTTKALLAQAETDLQQAQSAQTLVEGQVKAGMKGESSLQEAKLEVLNAQITLEQYRSSYAADKATFGRVTLGMDEDYEPVPIELVLENLKQTAAEPVNEEEILAAAISNAPAVKAAQEKVSDAKENLRVAQADALPKLSVEAGIDEQGWKVSWGISFDLFKPDRSLDVKIAAANLDLAESQLEAAKERVRNNVLDLDTALQKALEDLERLPLEEEKWALEETVNKAKLDAGLLSESDWHTFQEEKSQFEQTAKERGVSLLLAYLDYRVSLGLDLNWEEWVK
jgi:outer membrane protein TolC